MTEREEFEAWGKLNNFSVQRQPADEKFADYMSLTTERAWLAWQAAQDAARYRFLEEQCRKGAYRGIISREAIDAAILAANKEQK